MTQSLDETPSLPQSPPKRPPESRQGASTPHGDDQSSVTSRNASSSNWTQDRHGGSFSEREASRREAQRSVATSNSSSSLSSNTMQNMPVMGPTSEPNAPTYARMDGPANFPIHNFPHPPPPPPPSKQDDAIGLLQRSGDLERRASRRFSTYQIQKHLGTSPNGVPVLASQNGPLPNRGRDVRESMNAVRLRGSYAHGRQRSANVTEPQVNGSNTPTPTGRENARTRTEQPAELATGGSPTRAPIDKPDSAREFESRDVPIVGGPVPSMPDTVDEVSTPSETESLKQTKPTGAVDKGTPGSDRKTSVSNADTPDRSRSSPELTPPPGKELTVFLQYKSKIKKYILPEGPAELTLGRLQLAFIEKFAWNTHNNGTDLPEIYLQDPVSGVRHELEDLNDVKDRSVLVLNVEPLDEVKRHFDDGVNNIRRLVQGVRDIVDGQGTELQRLSDRQLEAAKDIARLAVAPPASSPNAPVSQSKVSDALPADGDQFSELQSLRRDLAVLRQTYANFASDISTSMNTVRTKAGSVKSTAVDIAIPSFEGDAGRARVSAGKKEIAEESEKLVARVDDLQDLVEDLRKDVVTRGVRPLPRQLEAVGRDISLVTKELKKMQEFLRREKPIWTKIWEAELQLVCEERDQLTMQEDLAVDLEDDLEKASQTFALVEQATKEQSLHQSNGSTGNRSVSKNLPIDQSVDPAKAKDNVLGEVRALQPNHENRVEAIERAEKARKRELENRRGGPFQKELGSFVREGKLKKSGGVEALERDRNEKDDQIRKEVWERQQARAAEIERMEQEAAAAQEQPEGGSEENSGDQQKEEVSESAAVETNNNSSTDGAGEAAPADPPGT